MSKMVAVASPLAPTSPLVQLFPHAHTRLGFLTKHPLEIFLQPNKWVNLHISKSPRKRKTKKFHRSYATLVEFPRDYDELLQQATNSTKAALQDRKMLLEVEFPTAGLESVSGDAEGGIEMTRSMVLVRDFCNSLAIEQYARIRIFFPDMAEVARAKMEAFEGTSFKLDYLTKPSGLEDFGFGRKLKMADRLKPTDKMVVVAYPYFNVNEMLAVEELHMNSIAGSTIPMLIFNGELDRIRSGCILHGFFFSRFVYVWLSILPTLEDVTKTDYNIQLLCLAAFSHLKKKSCLISAWSQSFWYNKLLDYVQNFPDKFKDYPSFFYPKISALSKNLLPKFETVYYIHNFKGRYGGTLFRAYPGPWQVLRMINNVHKCILQRERMPSLKEVALDILPQA